MIPSSPHLRDSSRWAYSAGVLHAAINCHVRSFRKGDYAMGANHALRRARLARGWSQAVVADHIETSPKNISRWEHGHTRPSPFFRVRLCQLFDMDASALDLIAPDSTLTPLISPASTHPVPIFDPEIPRLTIATGKVIGRAALLDDVLISLQNRGTSVLFGLPGIGKTTLAQYVSQQPVIRELFPDGLLWVSLGPEPTVHSELLRLATLLGMPEDEKVRDTDALSRYVHHLSGERRLLIVIDDAWNVDAVLPFLIGGPHVAHLLTTRLPELALALPQAQPCSVPELDAQHSHAFLTTLVPDLAAQSSEILPRLLQYTGGLPLALTLLGHYLRTQTIGGQQRRMQAALDRLSDARLRLRVAAPLGPPLQPASMSWSLESLIGISDHYLSSTAQQALRSISVLPARPGRFSEAAALAVSGHAIDVLDQLLDAGLLEGAGEGWYHMHQAIADYARLHRTEIAPLQRLIRYAHQLCASPNLEAEYSAVLAACDAALALSQGQDLLDMILALLPFWRTHGYYDQAASLLSTALDSAVASDDTTMRAHLLAERAQFAVVLEKWELARQCAQTGLELSHEPRIRAQCLQTLGSVALQHGNRAQARAFYEEGISLARACDDHERHSYLLNLLSGLIFQQGDYQQSERLDRKGLHLARQENNPELICRHLASLGIALQMQANYPASERYLREGLQLTRQLNYQLLQARMLMNLGVTVSERGDLTQGESFFQEGLALSRHMDDSRAVRRFLMNLGAIAVEQQAYDDAEQYIRDGLAQDPQNMDVGSRGMLLAQLGVVLGKQGAIQQAQTLFEQCVGIAHDLANPWLLSSTLCSWGDVCLQDHQLDSAAEHFQAALAVYQDRQPQRDMIATAQFGLAKVAALQGKQEQARQLAEQCLQIFTELHHRTTTEVQAWLATLPPPSSLPTSAQTAVSSQKSPSIAHKE